MPRNQKLTRVVGGRTVQRATAEAGKLVIRFDDESTMQVKTPGVADIFPPGSKVKAVHEDGVNFSLQSEEGPTVKLQLADPGASVAVRDKGNVVEYLG
jgi:hypothetical protein